MSVKKIVFLSLIIFAFSMSCMVFAGEYVAVRVEIPVSFFADTNADNEFTAVMEPINTAPAPEFSKINVKGTGSDVFAITINDPGTYRYKVYQIPPEDKNTVYDSTVYTVIVFVTEDKNKTDGLKYAVTAAAEGKEGKPDKIDFDNRSKNYEGGGEKDDNNKDTGGSEDSDSRDGRTMGGGKSSGILNKTTTTDGGDGKDDNGTVEEGGPDDNNENNGSDENAENNGSAENNDGNGDNTAPEDQDANDYAGRDGTGIGGVSVINNKDNNDNNDNIAAETVNTGDNSVQGLWEVLMCVSLAVMVISAIMEKRQKA